MKSKLILKKLAGGSSMERQRAFESICPISPIFFVKNGRVENLGLPEHEAKQQNPHAIFFHVPMGTENMTNDPIE